MNQHHLGDFGVTKKRKEKKLPSFIHRYTRYLLVMRIELWYPWPNGQCLCQPTITYLGESMMLVCTKIIVTIV